MKKAIQKEQVVYNEDKTVNSQELLKNISGIAYLSDFVYGESISRLIDSYVEEKIKFGVVVQLTVNDFKFYLLERFRQATGLEYCFINEESILEIFAELDEFEKEYKSDKSFSKKHFTRTSNYRPNIQ